MGCLLIRPDSNDNEDNPLYPASFVADQIMIQYLEIARGLSSTVIRLK